MLDRNQGEGPPPAWPELHYNDWRETLEALHLWTQIVGKVRVAQAPWLNHSWQSALYVTCRGLTTSPMPYGQRSFSIDFDFADQRLVIATADGEERALPLKACSVAEFHDALFQALEALGLSIEIHGSPSELPEAIPFVEDREMRPYDGAAAQRFFRALLSVHQTFAKFRTGFLGKSSPVHFFWGSFDLAVTRFSGRRAPEHPGGFPNLPDAVAREAYSHEVSSAGFWPGGGGIDYPAFYSYAYPTPDGFGDAKVEPADAFFEKNLGEFVLPYDVVRSAADPERTLLSFLQSTYEAAADLASWDRDALECPRGRPGVPRPLE